jgi:hypothetical protein
MIPAPPPEVAAIFAAAPPPAREGLLALRTLIFRTADQISAPLTETLRWGQPAYLAPKGSTIRLGLPRQGGFAVYCHCQTSLIADFRLLAGDACHTEGNRVVLFSHPAEIDAALISHLIARALTWHQRRSKR